MTTKVTGSTPPKATPAKAPKTLTEAIRYFADEDRCVEYLVRRRWPDGEVKCPYCGSGAVLFLKNQRRWKCSTDHPRRQFSVKVGTVFEDSPLSLTKWLPAVWLIANCKNGVSSLELHRAIGVTQKTAWFMLHRIRFAMQRGSFDKFSGGGPVEVDETFIGAKARNMHKNKRAKTIKGRGSKGKAMGIGLLDRQSQTVRLTHLGGRDHVNLQGEVRKHVEPGSMVFTDAFPGYGGLEEDSQHMFVNHAETYVEGQIHTNGIENFWALLKRTVKGTYVAVEPFHLHRYLDEQAFRYNTRKHEDGDAGRFEEVIGTITGRRLMYQELIGGDCAPTAVTA